MQDETLHAGEYLRSILGGTVFFLLIIIATPLILFLFIISLGRLTNFVIEDIAPLIAKPVLFILGIRFSIMRHGEAVDGPAIYIINHNSTLDVLTILALGLPKVRFVAKWEFQYNPIFLLLGRLTGQIFINRKDSEKAISILQKTYRRIRRRSLSILMAPEGSRKHPGIIGPFKKGPFRMAMDLNYPIVPVYFEGNRQLNIEGSLFTKSGKSVAHIYPPIDVSGWTTHNLDEHISDVRQQYMKWAGEGSPA